MGSMELKMAIITGFIVVLIQPVFVVWLVLSALDNFIPQFSAHVMAELHQELQHGNLNDSRMLRHPPD